MRKLISILLIVIILAASSCFFFLDTIIAFSIGAFSDITVSYESDKGNILTGSKMTGLRVRNKKGNFNLFADKALLKIQLRRSLEEKKLILDSDMQGVKFETAMKSTAGTPPEDNVMAAPFSGDRKYKQMKFTAYLDGKTIKVLGFKAISPDVKMMGNCDFFPGKNNIMLDLKIAFSPEASSAFPEEIRKEFLSPDDNGWYSTVISYKGNVLMLMALYSLTMSP